MMYLKAFNKIKLRTVVFLFFSMVSYPLSQGLPGDYLLTERWRDLASNYSPVSNPAFLTQENYLTFRGILRPSIYGNLAELGATLPIGLYQSAGVSWLINSSSLDTITDRQLFAAGYQSNALMGTYAINPWNGLSVGLNINIILVNAFGESKNGFGADLGISHRLIRNALLGTHHFGIIFQNLLQPTITFDDGNMEKMSRNLRFTLNSTYWEKRIESNFNFGFKDFPKERIDFSTDEAFNDAKTPWEFTGRIGYTLLQAGTIWGLFGMDDKAFKYFGLALTGNVPSVWGGRDFGFGYQFNRLTQDENNSSTFYFRAQAGDHRELMYAKKMANQLDAAPNELYIKALSYYSEGKYWDAFFLFSRILNEYPDFFKNDWVTYFSGNCQEMLDMREIALLSFNALKLEYPQSSAVAPGDLASMRIYYRNEDYNNVARLYQLLSAPTISDSLQNSAAFIMGQAQMAQRAYQKAIEMFRRIPPEHPDYIFAQHSSAIAYLALNKAVDAVTYLQNCIGAMAVTPAQKEVLNRSYLYLGYILYENIINEDRPLSKAVSLLRKIPNSSIYYNEALLVLGWTAIKAQQYPDCVNMGLALQNCKNPVFYSEGSLIAAYGYMRQGNYPTAKDILVAAADRMSTLKPPSEDTLALQRQKYIDIRTSYDFLARKVAECAQKQQAGPVLEENNQLHGQQKDSKIKIDLSMNFFDTYKKESFLTRNVSAIKEDLTYMLAVVSKRVSDTKSIKEINKANEKVQDIDKEIEKLKGQLDKETNK
jgi:tetratricopeptide (TPR) repeat protein